MPGDSPQVVLIAGGFDAATAATVEWLARRHGVELSCFAVSFLRFGAERLLTVRREFPPREPHAPDPAAEVQQLLGEAASASRPPAFPAHPARGVAPRASSPRSRSSGIRPETGEWASRVSDPHPAGPRYPLLPDALRRRTASALPRGPVAVTSKRRYLPRSAVRTR